MALKIKPLTLGQANELVSKMHRHHKPVRGHRFSLGATDKEGRVVGAITVSRPVARKTDQHGIAEVSRLVTDGTKNACSFLYAAAARVCFEMGFDSIQTFILETEPGTSLRAAGWDFDLYSAGGLWHRPSRARESRGPSCRKQRWSKTLKQ